MSLSRSQGKTSQRSCPRPGPQAGGGLTPRPPPPCLPRLRPHPFPYNADLAFAQPFPRSPHVGVLFFFLLFATSCVPKSQVRLTPMMLTDSQRACAARPVWRWAQGASHSGFICWHLAFHAQALPSQTNPGFSLGQGAACPTKGTTEFHPDRERSVPQVCEKQPSPLPMQRGEPGWAPHLGKGGQGAH